MALSLLKIEHLAHHSTVQWVVSWPAMTPRAARGLLEKEKKKPEKAGRI